jgi:hypothetical protein
MMLTQFYHKRIEGLQGYLLSPTHKRILKEQGTYKLLSQKPFKRMQVTNIISHIKEVLKECRYLQNPNTNKL